MAKVLHRLTAWHHFTGDRGRPSTLVKNSPLSSDSLIVAPDQYPVAHVEVSQLPPSVIHSPLRMISQLQIAFSGWEGSTVQRLFKHHVHGVPLGHFIPFRPALNCSNEKVE